MSTVIQRCTQILAVTALAFGLVACSKSEDSTTAGQTLDTAISKTEKAAENVGSKIEQGSIQAGDAAADALAKAGAATGAAVEQAGSKIEESAANAGAATGAAAEHAGHTLEEGIAKADAAFDDAGVTAAVKVDLLKAPQVSPLHIEVQTKGGVVTLSGAVPSEAAKTQAGDIAKAVKGVTSVTNNLTVTAG